MTPGRIEGSNLRLVADGCLDLHARRMVHEGDVVTITTAWQPSVEELAALNAGHSVYLTIFGGSHPPVYVGVGA